MQAVVTVFRVQLAFIVGEAAEEVEVFHAFLFRHGLQHPVDDGHVGITFGVAREVSIVIVGGQDALHDDASARRLSLDASHDFAYVHGDGVVAVAPVHVVGANHEKDHGRLALGDGLEAVEHASRDVGADATVLTVGVLEQLGPFTAISDAVAEEDDVVLRGRHGLEKQFALVVIGAELAGNLGETLDRHQHGNRKEKILEFHYVM